GGSYRVELPADLPRSRKRSFDSRVITRRVARRTMEAVRTQGARNGCTSFTVIAAAFASWLHRLTGQDDLVIGIPAAGQTEDGWQGLVGHCTSLLPVRSRFDGARTFGEFVKNFRGVMADAHENRAPSLGRIVQRLGIPRDPGI